jgi:hypothetical protein
MPREIGASSSTESACGPTHIAGMSRLDFLGPCFDIFTTWIERAVFGKRLNGHRRACPRISVVARAVLNGYDDSSFNGWPAIPLGSAERRCKVRLQAAYVRPPRQS